MKDQFPSNDEPVILLTIPGTGGWHNACRRLTSVESQR